MFLEYVIKIRPWLFVALKLKEKNIYKYKRIIIYRVNVDAAVDILLVT